MGYRNSRNGKAYGKKFIPGGWGADMEIIGSLIHKTSKAVLLRVVEDKINPRWEGQEIWFPLSATTHTNNFDGNYKFKVPDWLYYNKLKEVKRILKW